MTNPSSVLSEIREFGAHYRYDASYLVTLFEASPGAFEAFGQARGLSQYRAALPPDAHFVARVTAMQAADCGPCAQLNLRMALEAGVERDLLRDLVDHPSDLPEELQDLRGHVHAAVQGGEPDHGRGDRLKARFGIEGFAEIAIVVAGSLLYPVLKRAMLQAGHCAVLQVDE